MRYFAITHPKIPIYFDVHMTKTDSIKSFGADTKRPWKKSYRLGFRCIAVDVSEVKK